MSPMMSAPAAPTLSAKAAVRRAVGRLPLVGPAVERVLRRRPLLTAGEVAQYHGSGYIIFDPMLSPDLLDAAVAAVLDRPEVTKNLHHGSRVFDGWKWSRPIKQIALAPRVLRVLRQLYGRTPVPFQTLNFPVGTEQRVHSDVIHFNCDPPTYMCGVWVALEDIDLGNGALVYYPGSHKLPVVSMEDVHTEPGVHHYHLYEDYMERMVAAKNLRADRAILKKGQALIWAANLLHGGGSHPDKKRTRHSQVTHYYFEGCQYYTPLESYGGYRHLRTDIKPIR